jgi:hypothetical protein
MFDKTGNTAQNRLILTSLGILIIIILGLLVVLAAYPYVLAPAPTPTPAQAIAGIPTTIPLTSTITPTPTASRTPRPTFTPTITLTPTDTPTPTLTAIPLGPPTLTPEVPYTSTSAYALQPWSAEDADYVIAMMEGYPNMLTKSQRGEADQNYNQAFRYATVAEAEALLRYPDAPQANAWSWDLAYDLARQESPDAAKQYADLIANALNFGVSRPSELDHWFQDQEPRLSLTTTQVDPPPGYLSARLVNISGPGNAYILLLETTSGFQGIVLTSDFNFSQPIEYSAFASDLTGDGMDEIVIYPTTRGDTTLLSQPRVFSYSKIPPSELPFDPTSTQFDFGTNYTNNWEATNNGKGSDDLRFTANLFPACPVELSRTYHWNGEWFALDQATYNVEPNLSTLSYCRYVIETAVNNWGLPATIKLMETLLPHWPPLVDENGNAFPSDALDEWRFRLGVYYALTGDREKSSYYFNQIISSPSAPFSEWIAPAQKFMADYQKSEDIYKACVEAKFCDPRQAIMSLADGMSKDAYPRAMTILSQAGVNIRSSGYFDFDGDGIKESWFTVRNHPGEKLELWALVASGDKVRAIFLDTIDSNLPVLTYYQEGQVPPIVLIDNSMPFSIQRLPDSPDPYLTRPTLPNTYPNRFQEGLDAAKLALFSGTDPAKVRDDLLALQKSPGLLCRGTWSCDEYYYLLGLAAELAKDQPTTVGAYLQLWRDYSRSPFTTIARLKLRGVFKPPAATPTNTPTLLPTLNATLTSTPLVSPSVTRALSTPLPSQTVQVTPTYTPSTPYPIVTLGTPYP